MSLEVNSPPPTAVPQNQLRPHPLAPLTANEINIASGFVQNLWPAGTDLQFKAVTLQEPLKVEALQFLEAEHSGAPLPSIDRKAFVNYYLKNTVCFNGPCCGLISNLLYPESLP